MNRKKTIVVVSLIAAVLAVAGMIAVHLWMTERARTEKEIAERKAFYNRFGISADGTDEFVALPAFLPHALGPMRIGADLFHDARFFRNKYRTCAVCHTLSNGGTDNAIHRGVLTRPICNSAFASFFMHDGSISNVHDVVRLMIEDHRFGGGGSLEKTVKRLTGDDALVKRFKTVYPDGFTPSNIVDAVVNYQRTLMTPRGRFDEFCNGKANALSDDELRGFDVFKRQNCAQCHSGPALGSMKMISGIKVPALRGLAFRTKYMRDGSRSDLSAVLPFMPAKNMSAEDRSALIKFLKCL